MHSDTSDRLTPIKRFVLRRRGFGMILKAMAPGSQPMVLKPVGVRTAWCVGVGIQERFRGRNLASMQYLRPRCNCHGQTTGHKENTTVHKAKEGRVSDTR